jgi:hypothetical protein
MVRNLLRQGMTPGKVAFTVVLGLVFCVFPIVGIPTLLCTVAAVVGRMNLPLIQAVNYAGAPLQWLLIVPFLRIGEKVTGSDRLPLTPAQVRHAIEDEGLGFFVTFAEAGLHAALGWLLVCPLVAVVAYLGFQAWFRGSPRWRAPCAT